MSSTPNHHAGNGLAGNGMRSPLRLRCAVYTRKSSEEGLDQEFNSLDAQREACSAFIASQAGLGWRLLPDIYDDGGISGGTMERPALQRLLQDIRDKKVEIVVVYKIDRLTRSLTDFARIVEVFDASDISFVSVTQQFNTTTSMGRLTLNVLLSFAQFEREVTTERIRDKIAASKRKGMWMGGTVPLGYEVKDRKLLVKEPEAGFVRYLFTRYLELRSVPKLASEVTRQAVGFEARQATSIDDDAVQMQPATYVRRVGSGMLYKLLANPIYVGKIKHLGNVYDGEQQPIIEADQFAKVQILLASQAATPRGSKVHADVHMLNGLLFDDSGDRMSPTHAKARGKRFRYYISSRIKGTRRTDNTAWRLPAPEIEVVVLRFATKLLGDQTQMSGWLCKHAPSSDIQRALNAATTLGIALQDGTQPERRTIVLKLFHKITLGVDAITFTVNVLALVRMLAISNNASSSIISIIPEPETSSPEDGDHEDPLITLTLPINLKRRGNEMRLVIVGENNHQNPDPALIKLVAQAHVYLARMKEQPGTSITDIANEFGVHRADVGRVLPLAFLAPRLIDQILTGSQSVDLSARQLARQNLPLAWSEQINAFA